MAETPSVNDNETALLYKLAQNLYEYGVGVGASNLVQPVASWNDFSLLKNAVNNTYYIAQP